MRRNVSALAGKEYDLVIVGGGIFGICAAWDATLRGLSVALIDQNDFAHAASSNCFKIVHGGIRYLQHFDIARIRQSSVERNMLLRIAPHLVEPFPIAIPTYGHGMKGKEILRLALSLYNLIAFDRNRGISDPERRVPAGHFISAKEALKLFPGLNGRGLTGAAIIFDGQMYSPARLALSFLRSAVEAGAMAANYVEAVGFLRKETVVSGVKARDTLTGEQFDIRGKVVLNAAGPWAEQLLGRHLGRSLSPGGTYSRDAYFTVGRPLLGNLALAVTGKTKDPDAILSRRARHLFIVPWHGCTLIGVWHVVHKGTPDEFRVTRNDLQEFIDEVNEAYPPLELKLSDVSMWNAGLVLFGENGPGATDLSYGKRSLLIDHANDHGISGTITLVGARYTTARSDAERAVDLIFMKLGKHPQKCRTAITPIAGGRIDRFDEFLREARDRDGSTIGTEAINSLAHCYGSDYGAVLQYLGENPALAQTVGVPTVIKAQVVHAVREEMAQKLGDVVFRRTDLGAAGYPGEDSLRCVAEVMKSELHWAASHLEKEVDEVNVRFPQFRQTSGGMAEGNILGPTRKSRTQHT